MADLPRRRPSPEAPATADAEDVIDTLFHQVSQALETGSMDEYLLPLSRALAKRNDIRKEQVLQLVKEVYGPEATVSERRLPNSPPPQHESATARDERAADREDRAAAAEFTSADITPGLPTAFGSDFRANRDGGTGVAPATAVADIGGDDVGGGHVRVSEGGVIGGGSEIENWGAQVGADPVDPGTGKEL